MSELVFPGSWFWVFFKRSPCR